MNFSRSSSGAPQDTASELFQLSLENGLAPTGRHGTHANLRDLTNAACKVIDIVSQNADYRRPMSRMNLLDTKATPTYSVCRRWPGREPLASQLFNSDSPQLPMTLQDP
jgi:hypothetical protein